MMELFHRPVDPGVGYWGERTSAVDWCEPNYIHSYYIAEFFNTITSLPAAFLALYGIYLSYKYGYEKRFVVANLLVGMVGLGSAGFHGTLLYTGQILDELPMVYASLSLLYIVLEMEAEKEAIHKYLGIGLLLYSLLFTGVYLYVPSFFIFFLIGYILGILTLVYRCSLIYRKSTTKYSQKVFIIAAICLYIGGWLFFWIPEILFCDSIQSLNFHSWWHVTSTFGCFVLLLFAVFQREFHRNRNPQLNYNYLLGVPLLPYIHIPIHNQQSSLLLSQKELEMEKNKVDNSLAGHHDDVVDKSKSTSTFRKKSSVSSFLR